MNELILVGNLSTDVELRYTDSEVAIATFKLATDRPPKPNGEKGADFHYIKAFGKLAENCSKYLQKGRKAAIIGSIRYNKYEKDDETKWFTEISASRVEFLSPAEQPSEPVGFEQVIDDDIPF